MILLQIFTEQQVRLSEFKVRKVPGIDQRDEKFQPKTLNHHNLQKS